MLFVGVGTEVTGVWSGCAHSHCALNTDAPEWTVRTDRCHRMSATLCIAAPCLIYFEACHLWRWCTVQPAATLQYMVPPSVTASTLCQDSSTHIYIWHVLVVSH